MAINLENARYINFATYRKNGAAVNTPVWFAEDQGKYYIFSESKAGKLKRLRNSSKSRIAPCDMRGRLLGEWVDTQANILNAPEEEQHGYDLLLRKYGWQMRIANFFSRLSGKINQRVMVVIQVE